MQRARPCDVAQRLASLGGLLRRHVAQRDDADQPLLAVDHRQAAELALANTYSNTVMIGIPLIGLAYGADGMVVLLTLICGLG